MPIRRGDASAAGLLLGLVAVGLGMSGQAPALPDGVVSGLFWLPLRHLSFVAGAAVLLECLAAAVSLASPRPRWSPAPCVPAPG